MHNQKVSIDTYGQARSFFNFFGVAGSPRERSRASNVLAGSSLGSWGTSWPVVAREANR